MEAFLSSSPVGAPGFVTWSNTDLQSITLIAENFLEYRSRFSRQNAGYRVAANEHMIHSRWPRDAFRSLLSPASVDVHPCLIFWDFQTRGHQGAKRPFAMEGSVAPMMYPPCVLPVPSRSFEE
jgi:hypothetical protein